MRRDYWQQQWIDKQYVKAELSFGYETGEIPAEWTLKSHFTTQKMVNVISNTEILKRKTKAIQG